VDAGNKPQVDTVKISSLAALFDTPVFGEANSKDFTRYDGRLMQEGRNTIDTDCTMHIDIIHLYT
jgi:hypothetical protein